MEPLHIVVLKCTHMHIGSTNCYMYTPGINIVENNYY